MKNKEKSQIECLKNDGYYEIKRVHGKKWTGYEGYGYCEFCECERFHEAFIAKNEGGKECILSVCKMCGDILEEELVRGFAPRTPKEG